MVTLHNGILSTDLYTKSTDTHQYLHASSCHPLHCKASIPYSQALRIERICSSEYDFKKHTDELQSFLINREYNTKSQIRRASLIQREDILIPRSNRKISIRIPLGTTFHPNLPELSSIINMHLPLLLASSCMKQAFPERPLVAYRRPSNLHDLLVHANLKPSHLEPARGSSPCESKRCLTCQHICGGISTKYCLWTNFLCTRNSKW